MNFGFMFKPSVKLFLKKKKRINICVGVFMTVHCSGSVPVRRLGRTNGLRIGRTQGEHGPVAVGRREARGTSGDRRRRRRFSDQQNR